MRHFVGIKPEEMGSIRPGSMINQNDGTPVGISTGAIYRDGKIIAVNLHVSGGYGESCKLEPFENGLLMTGDYPKDREDVAPGFFAAYLRFVLKREEMPVLINLDEVDSHAKNTS